MTGRTPRSTLAALLATGLGALLALTLLVQLPSVAAVPVTAADNCSREQRNAQAAQSNERDAANARSVASRKYFQARDEQRANPSPANKRRAQKAYGDWRKAINQHEQAKGTNQAAKRALQECERR